MADLYLNIRCPLSRLVVRHTLLPLTNEELLQTIENNQTALMFEYKNNLNEKILRDNNGFATLLDKYPPIFANDLSVEVYGTKSVDYNKGAVFSIMDLDKYKSRNKYLSMWSTLYTRHGFTPTADTATYIVYQRRARCRIIIEENRSAQM